MASEFEVNEMEVDMWTERKKMDAPEDPSMTRAP